MLLGLGGQSVSSSLTRPCHSNRLATGRYCVYVSDYVEKCPFHLFDTERKRNISRTELKDDIITHLMGWIGFPLAYSEVLDVISDAVRLTETSPRPIQWREDIRPFVFSAMTKNPLINGVERFVSALKDELEAYNSGSLHVYSRQLRKSIPIHSVLLAVRELIHTKPAQTLIPSHRVREQITLFGQYAILSHRWYQDEEELSFVDVSNISDPGVQAKKGFEKLIGFSNVVKSLYGSRYLWVDSACIDEADRNASIPLMFEWYRRAYVCVIYFSTISTAATSDPPFASRDPWSTRGWTLQEFLAPNRIVKRLAPCEAPWRHTQVPCLSRKQTGFLAVPRPSLDHRQAGRLFIHGITIDI